ncbi:CRISPR-associated endonuclease Cas1 [Rapidithrix thailandica]|uniref:CRISPR-associated endonuclease Cas1 n=1 Tax=Rapidithrix thailandica TaxID=413964 RepID=A0AAW9RZI9_9BACT
MQLVIDTFGTSVHRKQNAFEIVNKEGKKRVSPQKIRTIVLNCAAKISSDAVILAVENEIDILFVDKSGKPQARVWSHKFGPLTTIRKNQLKFAESQEGLAWAGQRVWKKMQQQAAFLYQLRYSFSVLSPEKIDACIKTIEAVALQLQELLRSAKGRDKGLAASCRGWEGTASRHYFQGLAWALPPGYHFAGRTKRPAKDPFNCVLNYLYGMLYSFVEVELLKAGIDPHIGVLHADQYKRPVFVYDFIESYRIWADTVAFRLFQRYALNERDFEPCEGGLWLAGSGKREVIPAFHQYLYEPYSLKKKQKTRMQHLSVECRQLAKSLLQRE